MDPNNNSGFAVKSIILTESTFTRINNVAFGKDIKNDISINVIVSVKDKTIKVEEKVILTQKKGEDIQARINVKTVGVFEKIGESELTDLEEFGRINGASIIYPYVREHISSLAQKGGLGTLLIPPVNFTKSLKKE